MNLAHRWICSSSRWRKAVARDLLPWTLSGINLGSSVLELGAGYGAVSDVLRKQVPDLTLVEVDQQRAAVLRQRNQTYNVNVVCADATTLSLPAATYDTALCFMMLHHIPTACLQDQLFANLARILRPGGSFVGLEGRDSLPFRILHLGDKVLALDPATLQDRLQAAGFEDVELELKATRFRFRARKPFFPSAANGTPWASENSSSAAPSLYNC